MFLRALSQPLSSRYGTCLIAQGAANFNVSSKHQRSCVSDAVGRHLVRSLLLNMAYCVPVERSNDLLSDIKAQAFVSFLGLIIKTIQIRNDITLFKPIKMLRMFSI